MNAVAGDGLVPEIAAYDYWGAERLSLAVPTLPVTVGRMAWEYPHWRAYYLASYTKVALALRTLEGLIGPETMARGLRQYFDRFRFRHPTGRDLIDVLSEAAGRDLGPFFDQAISGDAVADWAVRSVRHRRPPSPGGFGWDGARWRELADERSPDDRSWLVDLELARRGEFIAPVEVELRWSDGVIERRTWDSTTRWVHWRFERPSRLEQVVIDPDVVWVLEARRADNYWRDRATTSGHPLWWVREGLRLAGHLFLRFS
jgi:hypothetical protein